MSALVINAQTNPQSKTTKTTKSTTTQTEKSARTPVQVADLPKAITDNVAKDYSGYTIKDAASVTANNSTTYHVDIMKGTTSETLVYDSNGKLLKKEGKGTTHKAAKKK